MVKSPSRKLLIIALGVPKKTVYFVKKFLVPVETMSVIVENTKRFDLKALFVISVA